ncbi:DUF4270 family protein [Pedobacter xixiisoli]|uniref:DUF4270 domain-containing protein n=1 Tax=Pedobacter xixiisoli TaxID=1476464 RepID=A0A286ADC4_9SPHI|nr:DUF4270 family protein [Pedobacter xixiisoli]SOD19893.1 protein of unknown function [Pedobacter xixiisoli]
MRFLKLDLLTLLISLFLFASCENTSTIGLEVDPATAIQGNLIDTATISSKTVRDDAISTLGLSGYPFGYISDPELGKTESSLAFSVNIPNEAYSFGTAAVLDSAVLVLNFAGEFYGDSTANYTFDVKQLQKNLAKETSYLSSNPEYATQGNVLASYNGKIYPTTPIKVTDVLTGAKDTVKNVTPQIRLKLDNTFITNNLVSLNAASLKYNSYFQEAFKGLSLKIRNQTGKGMMFFNFASTTPTTSTSGLVLYYRKQNATTTTATDTVSVNFPISNSSGPVAANVSHDYSGTAAKTQLDDNTNFQYTETYLQPLGGLRTKLAFPYLKKMRTEVGKMVVNKAELIIDLKSGTDVAPFRAAPRLALYRFDIAGQRRNVPDNDTGDGVTTAGDPRSAVNLGGSFGGYFDSVNKRYVFTVTAYVQDLLDGKTEDYGTFLAVTPSSTFQFTSPFTTASRAIIGSFKKNPAAGEKVIKLNIYYTKVN